MARVARRAALTALAFLPLLAASCVTVPPPDRRDATVMGRVILGELAACGVRVSLLAPDGAVAAQVTTDDSGAFFASLPPGRYLVVAHDATGDPLTPQVGDHYAHPARNPVWLPPGGDAWIGLQMVTVLPEHRRTGDDPSSGQLAGTVLFHGQPVAGAVATLFGGGDDEMDRSPGLTSAPATGPDGTFSFPFLAPGRYRLAVRKRAGGGAEGPLREGDLEGYYPLNPIELHGGDTIDVSLEVVEKKRPFFIDNVGYCPIVGIAGMIKDGNGLPVQGVYVFAYRNREMAKGKPAAISALTGSDGRYQLPLPSGGRYYIGARETYGAPPRRGEWYGLFTGSAMHDLMVPEKGVLRGIDITVQKIIGSELNETK